MGIYAPSKGDRPEFFSEDVFPVLNKVEYDHVILGGDWNLGMDTDLDYLGYSNADKKRPQSRHIVHQEVQNHDLIDIYRELHQSGPEKTWRVWNKAGKKADKEARLDYFLVDTNMASFVELVGVAGPFTTQHDHRPVIMKVDFNKVSRGPGYWKFNNSMLNESDFCKKVRERIARILHEYQLPENPGDEPLDLGEIFLMPPAQQSALRMSLNPHQLLEFILFSIKGVARGYGKQRKTNLMTRKEKAESKLRSATSSHEDLVRKLRTGPCGDTEVAYISIKNVLTNLQKEILDIDTHLNEGAYIRCGAHWKCESEAPSKIFLQQEKWRGQQRFMGIIEVDGDEPNTTRLITNQPEIEAQINQFYSDLYKERETSSSDSDLKEFMGDEGYEAFKNCAREKISPYTFEKNDLPIGEDEVLAAITHGKHGVAPGLSGFSREFYQHFSKDLIGFIMEYIKYTEERGILSLNQRIGVITLLPKGQKDKKTLKNWRPITLLSTLYKIISGVIGNRFKQFLPSVIDLGQKGFVDGRQMAEITRLLYDTITDAYTTKGKKGIIMSIDFEKAFDSVSFAFMAKVIETAGFPKRMQTWIKILLNDFKSHINHAGNLLTLIELGRGARQGDPIASILFVLAIEVLLIAIRTNKKIEPYKYDVPISQPLSHKVEAYADDVNLMMPNKEESIREVISVLNKFEKLSGLKVNKDKTQVMRIGRSANSDPILCEDLGLKWVSKLKILGIFLTAKPADMMENLDDKIEEIDKLLARWTFRNLTVYGRIIVVKALALSKITHLIQVIPNPDPLRIQKLQQSINKFIWKGNAQKKYVVGKDAAELPQSAGGLAVPNLLDFWNSLKLAWLTRLIQSDESTAWKRLSLSKLSSALRISNLTSTRLLSESPHTIASAASALSNPFWQNLLKLLPQLERTFYDQNPKLIGEHPVWNRKDIVMANGKPFDRKTSSTSLVAFTTFSAFISETTNVLMSREEAAEKLGEGNLGTWNELAESITAQLISRGLTWYSVNHPDPGPRHLGWSRIVTESYKARKYYTLLTASKHSKGRNSNEKGWVLKDLTNYSVTRWNSVYRNQGTLRCNLRVKYEEWRIIWGRQELNRYKDKYAPLKDGNSTACSYCRDGVEDEIHLYNDCRVLDEFWHSAQIWFSNNFGVVPTLALRGYRLFGMEKEPSNDLNNIFYRCVRYSIYFQRKKTVLPSLKFLVALVRDELKIKYAGTRRQKYASCPTEAAAISWLKKEMGWTQTIPERMPT